MGTVLPFRRGAGLCDVVHERHWRIDLPPWLFVAAIGSAMVVGAVSSAYPAQRAMRLPPMEALRTG